MRKNIQNIVAIAIGISVMSGSIVSVFAADTTEKNNTISSVQALSSSNNGNDLTTSQNVQAVNGKQVITLDKAIDAAINNSNKLALKSKEIKMYEDKMELQEKIDDFYDSIDQKVYDFSYDKIELQKDQTEQSKKFMKDQIANDITNKYNAIILKEMDIDKSKKEIETNNRDLIFMKRKVELELATANQMKDLEIENQKLKDDIVAKENNLKNNKDYFKVLTDLDLEKYILDRNINYKPFKINGSVDEYLDERIDKYLKYNDEMIELTKDYLDELKDDDIKDIMDKDIPTIPDKSDSVSSDADGNPVFDSGTYALKLIDYQQKQQEYLSKLNGYGSYLDGKYSYNKSKVKLDDAKKDLKNGLKESYSTLLDLENKIKTLDEQVKSTNTKLRFAKAQVDMELLTQNDYDKQVLKTEDLDTSLRNLINTYNNLKDSIQKPWILGK